MERTPVRAVVWRGLRRRCGRCGAKRIFSSYFQLHERCPRCGYKFEREEGFFTGVYLVNYAITALLLVAMIFAFLLVAVASDGGDVCFSRDDRARVDTATAQDWIRQTIADVLGSER